MVSPLAKRCPGVIFTTILKLVNTRVILQADPPLLPPPCPIELLARVHVMAGARLARCLSGWHKQGESKLTDGICRLLCVGDIVSESCDK